MSTIVNAFGFMRTIRLLVVSLSQLFYFPRNCSVHILFPAIFFFFLSVDMLTIIEAERDIRFWLGIFYQCYAIMLLTLFISQYNLNIWTVKISAFT